VPCPHAGAPAGAPGATALEDLVVELLVRSPFFGHVLAGLDKRVVPGDSARMTARGARYALTVGEALLGRATRAQARGILKHELVHLLLEHPARRAEFPDPARFDLAADLVVGPLLEAEERGPWDTVPGDLPGLELPEAATLEVYYALLEAEPVGRGAPSDPDDPRAGGRRDHEGWGELAEGSAVERSLREAAFRDLVELAYQRSRRHGSLPGALERLLAELLGRPASLDWRKVLRRFRATADRTRVRGTMHRPSKRYGTVPGNKIRRLCRLVAVVDTSGSVGAEELASFSTELGHLARTDSDIWVIYCDAAVQRQEAFRGALPEWVPGGGGTAFDPGLRAAMERDPDGIVYLTDGHAGAVTLRPRCPVLWLLTPGGRDPAAPETRALLPGRIVRLRA
jgi:predicted metal-dependent peptidase